MTTPLHPSRLESVVDDYPAHCRAAGLSPKTIRHSYGYPLRSVFLPWCAAHEVAAPSDLTSRVLDRFVSDLLEVGGKRGELSKATAWSYAKAAKQFVTWLKKEGGGHCPFGRRSPTASPAPAGGDARAR